MNIKEYQKLANVTLVSLGDKALDGAHMAMGVATELQELYDGLLQQDYVNVKEEHGDVLWYIAGYCKIYDLDIEDLYNKALTYKDYAGGKFVVAELVDLNKKEFAYRAEMDLEKLKEQLVMLLIDLIDIADNVKFAMEQSMITNIGKLQVRYHDKFTREEALNRKLEKERRVLEK